MAKKNEVKRRDSLDRLGLITGGISLLLLTVTILVVVTTRMLSDDICLRDWDYQCTTAPGYVQSLNSSYFITVFLFYGFGFAFLAISGLNLVSKFFSWLKRRGT